MKKQAISPETLKTIIGTVLGGAAGAATGYEAMPRLGGYADVESARRGGGLMHGLTGAMVGGLIGRKGPAGAWAAIPPKARLALGPALIAEEVVPMGLATLKRTQEGMKQMGESAQTAAQATQASSIPEALKGFTTSPIGKGVGAGAALAGLAGILSGLTRRQSDEEFKRRKSRYGMISSDALKLMLPMMIAGGLGGSLLGNHGGTPSSTPTPIASAAH